MSGLAALAIALFTFVALFPAYRSGMPRLIYLTIMAGYGFWYWLPALNLLTVGYIGLDKFVITSAVDAACYLVLLSQVTILVLLLLIQPLFSRARLPLANAVQTRIPVRRLAQVCLASAIAFAIARFLQHGSAIFSELWTGQMSARSQTSFVNRSASAGASLLALWEITTTWATLFGLGLCILERRFLTTTGVAIMAAIAILFVTSGTRSILLQALFVGLIALPLRIGQSLPYRKLAISRIVFFAIPLAALGSAIMAAFTARFQGDGGYAAAGPQAAVLATVLVNNDMMRELAFALQTMQPSLEGAWEFVQTPFTFMMPSFLGFHKDIPIHLIIYNWRRSGIDINMGAGNVFPGLVGDFWLVFGDWMPVLLAGFIIFYGIVIDRLSRLISNTPARLVYQLVGLSYLFFSFRNITGALVLVLVIGIAIIWPILMFGHDNRRARETWRLAARGLRRRSRSS